MYISVCATNTKLIPLSAGTQHFYKAFCTISTDIKLKKLAQFDNTMPYCTRTNYLRNVLGFLNYYVARSLQS